MIHQYKNNGYNIVMDVCSGAIHVVDDVTYDVIALYEEKSLEEILQKEEADVILLARELLRNPYFVAKSSWENHQESFFPPQYERGKP